MTPAEVQEEIVRQLGLCQHDPLRFAKWAFPWGVADGPLEHQSGPDEWQEATLRTIGEQIATRQKLRIGTASGKGIGKSACVSWLILWGLMTKANTRGVVTANTDTQLRTKTWPELAKWYGMLVKPLRDLFTLEATSIHCADEATSRTWRIDAIPWSEKNAEAFAGLHNQGRRIIVVFDEASSIADSIWDTTDGVMSDVNTEVLWAAFGNPTRNTGRFRECFRRFRDLWATQRIDSRSVKITDKDELQGLIAAYGEDSDYIRVNIRGEFPRAASTQFIPEDVIEAARKREPGYIASDPFILGVDVARFGEDKSVMRVRRGRDAKTYPTKKWRGADTMQVAGDVAREAAFYADKSGDAPYVMVDVGGVGAGVVDRLIQLAVPNVIGVNFGSVGGDAAYQGAVVRTANKRAFMWGMMREWMRYGAIEDDRDLTNDLAEVQYGYNVDNAIQLERKQDMKKRGVPSPDDGDALALTFAEPVSPIRVAGHDDRPKARVQTDYDLFAAIR